MATPSPEDWAKTRTRAKPCRACALPSVAEMNRAYHTGLGARKLWAWLETFHPDQAAAITQPILADHFERRKCAGLR